MLADTVRAKSWLKKVLREGVAGLEKASLVKNNYNKPNKISKKISRSPFFDRAAAFIKSSSELTSPVSGPYLSKMNRIKLDYDKISGAKALKKKDNEAT